MKDLKKSSNKKKEKDGCKSTHSNNNFEMISKLFWANKLMLLNVFDGILLPQEISQKALIGSCKKNVNKLPHFKFDTNSKNKW